MVLGILIGAAPANAFAIAAPLATSVARFLPNACCIRRSNSTAAIDISAMMDVARVDYQAQHSSGSSSATNVAKTDSSLTSQSSRTTMTQSTRSTAAAAAAAAAAKSSVYGINIYDRKRLYV